MGQTLSELRWFIIVFGGVIAFITLYMFFPFKIVLPARPARPAAPPEKKPFNLPPVPTGVAPLPPVPAPPPAPTEAPPPPPPT
ncbi:MAG TPA: hypothetical protein DCZ72_14025 [Armatimonadetes bacterium]|nr:hypothetical protein [Armatimonadota bacterium]